jgi:hypothetical protein
MKSFLILLRLFLDICIFKKNPQDIPSSSVMLSICIFLYTLTAAIVTMTIQDPNEAGISSIIEVCLVLLLTYIFLYLRMFPERWLQTCTAILGVGILFGIMAFPFYMVIAIEGLDGNNTFILSVGVLLIFGWNLAVIANILKYALNMIYFNALLVSLVYVFVTRSVIIAIVPQEII